MWKCMGKSVNHDIKHINQRHASESSWHHFFKKHDRSESSSKPTWMLQACPSTSRRPHRRLWPVRHAAPTRGPMVNRPWGQPGGTAQHAVRDPMRDLSETVWSWRWGKSWRNWSDMFIYIYRYMKIRECRSVRRKANSQLLVWLSKVII